MTPLVHTEITTLDEAKAFVEALAKDGDMFHFEDNVAEIFNDMPRSIIEKLQLRVAELYTMNWGDFECPIGYALDACERLELI